MRKLFVTTHYHTVSMPSGDRIDGLGFNVEADFITIEPSGALSFWRVVIPAEKSELILAIAHGEWKKVEG